MRSAGDSSILVVDEPSRQRYEARLDDQVVGFTEYRFVRGHLILFHTEVDPSVEGRGFGSRLISGTLDDIRARGLKITVKCPFITAYLERHPEDRDLVEEAATATASRHHE
jgi:predicted GNAT family acetyltransferase